MGCAVSGVNRTMSLFSKRQDPSEDSKAKLERKLYLAKESPEPQFDLSDCQLRHLPSGIFSICKVFRKDYIFLQNNRLHSLEEGGQLSDLHLIKTLNLSNNIFTRIPNNIRYLTSLTELYLQNNSIESLPEGIGYLQSLQILDVSGNKLKYLNPSLGNLKCLNKINITNNSDLHEICPELCFATNILSIELDSEHFTFPPAEICIKGTIEIMIYLCTHMNIKYVSPALKTAQASASLIEVEKQSHFTKQLGFTWEEQEASIKEQEIKIHKANQQQRERFLTQILQGQQELDMEIAKAQEIRESERQKFLKSIQKEEHILDCLLKNFTQSDKLKPEVIQQQLAYEQAEHDNLLEITRKNYDEIRKADIIKATKQLLEKDNLIQFYKNNYIDNLNNMKQNILLTESEGAIKLAKVLNTRDEYHTILVQQLLEDQDIQKEMVSSLLDRVDAKSWSLTQEISLISSHLSKLSVIEQEKKKIHMSYNYNELLNQRLQLVNLLDDLLNQKSKRKQQLIDILKEAEDNSSSKTDFWLKSYQKLLDTAPKFLFDAGNLDPVFANCLLQEGVIHCLPFLVKFLFSGQSLINITQNDLKECGVTLTVDRENIIKAIQQYVAIKTLNMQENQDIMSSASAPPLENIEQNLSGVIDSNNSNIHSESECVICMDSRSEVVFVPCGHMCCCGSCSESSLEGCPMCRTPIERIIKVIIVL